MLICLNDLFACSGLAQTRKLLTNFSKNSFYLLPEPLRLGEFLTNYWNGYKMKLFLLDLSFIGWMILSVLTLGIGLLFLQPYMSTARAAFYEDLKAELSGRNASEEV